MKANSSTKNVSWSAPGRVVLSGEYGALYGRPVIAIATDKRVIFTVSDNRHSGKSSKNKKEWFLEIEKATEKFLRKKNRMQNKAYTTSYSVSRSLHGYFGFDKALLSASAAALLAFYNKNVIVQEAVSTIAFSVEKKLFKSIGIDTAASVYGGIIYFRKEFEFLKTVSKLQTKIPKKIEDDLYIILLNKNINKKIQEEINKLFKKNPSKAEKFLAYSEKLTKRLLISLMSEDSDLFEKTIREEQKILCETINLQKSILKLIGDINISGSSKICENILLIYGKRENVKKTARENGLIFYKLNQSDEGIKPHGTN